MVRSTNLATWAAGQYFIVVGACVMGFKCRVLSSVYSILSVSQQQQTLMIFGAFVEPVTVAHASVALEAAKSGV